MICFKRWASALMVAIIAAPVATPSALAYVPGSITPLRLAESAAPIETVQYRRGYYGRGYRGYGRRHYNPGAGIVAGIAGLIIGGAIANSRREYGDRWAECEARYKSFSWDDGTFQPYGDGPRELCPYLRG